MTSSRTRTPAIAAFQIFAALGAAAPASAQCPRLFEPFELFEPAWDREGWTGYRHFGSVRPYSATMVGGSLDGGGDFNGDGLTDIIIGAPHDQRPGTYCEIDTRSGSGSVYIVLNRGGAAIGPHPDRSLVDAPVEVTRVIPGDGDGVPRLGNSVAFIGDINGDGFDDVAMGRPEIRSIWRDYVVRPAGAGQVFVVFGGPEQTDLLDPADLDGSNGFRI